MRKLLVLVVLAGVLGSVAGEAPADRDLILTATPHRHFVDKDLSDLDSRLVEVGPRWCDNLSSDAVKRAFTQFHANVHFHLGVIGEYGPQAPGLHNGKGPELVGNPGCGYPPAASR